MNVEPTELVTRCGRRLTTGRFQMPTTPTIERVVLRVDPDEDCCDTVWASLTADEAITLAHALIAQAGAIRSR
jgi:hypothetical protein